MPRSRWFSRQLSCWLVVAAGMVAAFATLGYGQDEAGAERPISDVEREFFEKQVRPILAEHCYECHSHRAEKLQAGLHLDSRAGMLSGGDSGPAIVPGDASASLLMEAVRYESFEMPPSGRLPDAKVSVLARWIDMGAPWPSEPEPRAAAVRPEFDWQARAAEHWAWQKIAAPEPPRVRNGQWPRGPIDAFVLQAMEVRQLAPAPDAQRQSLIRRAYFTLTGLPPTREQLDAWLHVDRENWFEELVDQLLASPAFGETWGRHWLDLVRYAETCGHEFDYPIHHAYRYRDYVIRAFNANVPYDQFVREHIAGDLMPKPRRHPQLGFNESILGTGFWFLGESVHAPTDVRADEADRIDNQIDVMCKTFLGLTVACARCHDHKFDPIPTEDYYALAGFLQSSRRQIALLDPNGKIGAKVAAIDHLRGELDEQRTDELLRVLPSAERLAELLRALRDEAIGRSDAEPQPAINHDVAATPNAEGADSERLANLAAWRALLADDPPNDPADPWFLMAGLLRAAPDEFAATWRRLADRVQRRHEAVQQWRARAVLLADFARDDHGWMASGWAWDRPRGSALTWDWWDSAEPLVGPGRMHSGLGGGRLQGVLRSPTFELSSRQIHYHMKGRGVDVRLIVDGYFMDEFNELLFADCTLTNVDTKGAARWVTQRRDLDHYVGHRAHLEIIDHGNGYANVGQIWMSDQGPPPAEPHPWNMALAAAELRSWDDLVGQLQGLWMKLVDASRRAALDDDQVDVLNGLLRRGLLTPKPPSLEADTIATTGVETANIAVDNSAAADTATDAIERAGIEALRRKLAALDAEVPEPMAVLAICDGTGEDERVHIRGSHRNLGDPVPRRLLVAIAGQDQPAITHGSGRWELAERMTSPDNPFLARVMVNRIWHHLFGRGIVASVDDFGAMGQAPSHPELLDWLAADFIRGGWSIKRMIRQIMLSRTYQLDSRHPDAEVYVRDPDNVYLSRAPVRRLTAEAIRDAVLQVSGRLDRTMFGPSVPVHLTPFMTGRGRPKSGPLDGDGRRSIYIEIRRNFLSPAMLTFDMPIPFNTMGRRSVSNVPAQSLVLMNDPFIHQQARVWAERVLIGPESSTDARLDRIFLTALARRPDEQEREVLHAIVDEHPQRGAPDGELRVWADVCHIVLNMKEFIFLP